MNTKAHDKIAHWLTPILTAVAAAATFTIIAPFGDQILFCLGCGHAPGQQYVGHEQDLAIFLAEAFVIIFLSARILSASISPKAAIEHHLLSQTLLTYIIYSAGSLAGGFLDGTLFNPILNPALKSAVTMAVFPGSSLVLLSMSMAAGWLICRMRGIATWAYQEWIWLYAAVLTLVVSVLALIFTSQISV